MSGWETRFAFDVQSLVDKMKRDGTRLPSYVPLHIAALYSGRRTVACASNMYERHAEVNCLRAIDPLKMKQHKPLRLLVSRVSGSHRMSRPCSACSVEIRRRLPRARVFYTDWGGTFREDKTLDNTHVCHMKSCVRAAPP
tara:strand:+ start:32 stop:451 length:420 start_codon:yes stop_codon:yes gene_type:complete